MLQLYPVFSLLNRRKTLTGSPDPTRANGTNKPCTYRPLQWPPRGPEGVLGRGSGSGSVPTGVSSRGYVCLGVSAQGMSA